MPSASSPTPPPPGLTGDQARDLQRQHGRNDVSAPATPLWRGVAKRLWGPIPWMLEVALLGEAWVGRLLAAGIIGAWLVFSAIVGATQERRAQRALDLLRARLHVSARVRRDGHWQVLAAGELVPGDVVGLRPGDLVPADCLIAEGAVELDLSALTGESAPASRGTGEMAPAAATVQRGEAVATVSAIGSHTAFGRTAELVRGVRTPGHLDRLLFQVVRRLVAIDALLTLVLVVAALIRGESLVGLLPFLLVLVTAVVPVTMPAAFTVANAVEARRLAHSGVLVTGLEAVQEAATMDVLCVDKTGTLTQNRQHVAAVAARPGEREDDVLAWAAAACDEATPGGLERAIVDAAAARGASAGPRRSLQAFDPALKRSEAVVDRDGELLRVVLGAPSVVLPLADAQQDAQAQADALAADGMRVLAVAAGTAGHLTLRGWIGLADPPRDDAASLIAALRGLGIRVLMVSGDTIATARAVGARVGLTGRFGGVEDAASSPLACDGFAGFYPQDKHRLVQTLQAQGRVVGMTGDGVNDAPALRQAEVGIAVSAATDVAKAAARVVMTRPGLSDIVEVVCAGRRVYRRMLTWTITKMARTAELAALVAVGYAATGMMPLSLHLIALLVILNDVVTITLATDRADIAPQPEHWNLRQVARYSGGVASAWLALGLLLLWVASRPLGLAAGAIQSLMFAYLVYSAQATIYLTRVRGRCWSSRPSGLVAAATGGNMLAATGMAGFGLLTPAVPPAVLAATLMGVCSATLVLDQAKPWLSRARQ